MCKKVIIVISIKILSAKIQLIVCVSPALRHFSTAALLQAPSIDKEKKLQDYFTKVITTKTMECGYISS